MKILCTCSQGNNRSVTFAAILKYVPTFETMTVGLLVNSSETIDMMCAWADVIIIPEWELFKQIPVDYRSKVKLYNVGPDVYPRPFNMELYAKIKAALDKDHIV